MKTSDSEFEVLKMFNFGVDVLRVIKTQVASSIERRDIPSPVVKVSLWISLDSSISRSIDVELRLMILRSIMRWDDCVGFLVYFINPLGRRGVLKHGKK